MRLTDQGNGDGDNGPQQVDEHGRGAAALAADDEELDGVEAAPATLALGVDALCDLVAIVVVLRQRLAPPATMVFRGPSTTRLVGAVCPVARGAVAVAVAVGVVARGTGAVGHGL